MLVTYTEKRENLSGKSERRFRKMAIITINYTIMVELHKKLKTTLLIS